MDAAGAEEEAMISSVELPDGTLVLGTKTNLPRSWTKGWQVERPIERLRQEHGIIGRLHRFRGRYYIALPIRQRLKEMREKV
jgi:hypothetical protein